MTKAQILAALAAQFKAVNTPEFLEEVLNSKKYLVNVLETGKDVDGRDIAYKRNVEILVYDEGGAGESAFYFRDSPSVSVDRANTTASGELEKLGRLLQSSRLTLRVEAAILVAASSIWWEASDTPNHAQRMSWAVDALANPQESVSVMLRRVCSDATIQIAGEAATDSSIQNLVNGNIDKVAITLFA
jgi:hypothetical protein